VAREMRKQQKTESALYAITIAVAVFAAVTLFLFAAVPAATCGDLDASGPYLQSLRTADVFLGLWLRRDSSDAWQMLSLHLRSTIHDRSWFNLYMTGLSNPRHEAFSIGHGAHGPDGSYTFPVTLYEWANGSTTGFVYRSRLVVTRERNQSKIDRLPISSDNPR
jgi:hypothetical protein